MKPEDAMRPLLHTIPQVCALLNLGRSSVYKLISSGQLEQLKFGTATRITDKSVCRVAAESMPGRPA